MLEFRDGTAYLRPAIDGLGRAIYQPLNQVDMFAIYSEVRCPLLLVNIAPGSATLAAGNLNVHLQALRAAMGSRLSKQRPLSR